MSPITCPPQNQDPLKSRPRSPRMLHIYPREVSMVRIPLDERRVLPRNIEDEYEDHESDVSLADQSTQNSTPSERALSSRSTDDSEISDDDGLQQEDDENEDNEEIRNISFGALAKAAVQLGPPSRPRKRKLSDVQSKDEQAEQKKTPKRAPEGKPNEPLHRSSKHAPAVFSSKHPVSRKRILFEPPAATKSRDPRFDATITSSTLSRQSSAQANKNYSFLSEYQAKEILALKSQMKKSKSESEKDDLKRQLMSLEAKLRNSENRKREATILQQHKSKEKQAIREGRKTRAYYLKPSEVRKQIEKERVESMGKRARDKMEKRKLKRQKGKEGTDMPRYRREVGRI